MQVNALPENTCMPKWSNCLTVTPLSKEVPLSMNTMSSKNIKQLILGYTWPNPHPPPSPSTTAAGIPFRPVPTPDSTPSPRGVRALLEVPIEELHVPWAVETKRPRVKRGRSVFFRHGELMVGGFAWWGGPRGGVCVLPGLVHSPLKLSEGTL